MSTSLEGSNDVPPEKNPELFIPPESLLYIQYIYMDIKRCWTLGGCVNSMERETELLQGTKNNDGDNPGNPVKVDRLGLYEEEWVLMTWPWGGEKEHEDMVGREEWREG